MAYSDPTLRYKGNVCISGLTAAGKTTHSHLLCGKYGLIYVSGSQIQLNFLGLSPIQTRDFWITPAAKRLWNEEDFVRIDSELLRLESVADGYIFDTSTMPWRHQRSALCIWLESTLESRVVKSVVSHHGNGPLELEEYAERVAEKDRSTVSLYKRLYGINIGSDLSCFDLVIDVSSLIAKPSLESAFHSIAVTHSIIDPAVGWYLTGRSEFRHAFEDVAAKRSNLIHVNKLLIEN